MPFTLGGVPVAFNVQQFETLVEQAASFSFRWKTSSMRALRDLANANATGAAMRQALTLVPQDRAVNYQEALKYLVYHYPGVIPPTDVVAVGNPQTGATFAEWVRFLNDFRRIRNDPDDVPESVGDVVYGADHGRTQAPYTGMNMMIMDNFNNAANIGTGFAFNRMWNMLGTLDADALSVRQTVTNSVQNQNAIGQQAMQQYYKGLTNSRYNPELVMGLSKDKLSKDRHKNTTQFQTHFQNDKKNRKKAEDHSVMHARMVKAVRRACKGGIAMVAKSRLFRANQCKIFFVLDCLGDLGRMAFKLPLPQGNGEYVAITTSELSFCFRFWNHSETPLRSIVKFFVNGDEVSAPWEGDWTVNDATGAPVFSNQEAWKRYELHRSLIKPNEKAFPVQATDFD